MKLHSRLLGVPLLFLLSSIGAAQSAKPNPATAPGIPIEQPIPFSHKVHAGTLKLKCKMCHPNSDQGETMRIAAASICMQCHAQIKSGSPPIQKLAAFAKNDREIPWNRVYQVPSFVAFSHKSHLDAGNTCTECHGQVAARDQLFREGDISMGGCMTCHRAKKAGIDCTFCHEQRN